MTSPESRGPLAERLPKHDPPRALEERVVRTLRARGLLAEGQRHGTPIWRRMLALAAGIVLFLAGGVLERLRTDGASGEADAGMPRYILLLYGGEAQSPSAEAERVREYASWARTIARSGRYVSGEKLRDSSRELTAAATIDRSASDPESLAGFFIVSAASAAEADSIARSCPHIRHGGKVVIRPIERT